MLVLLEIRFLSFNVYRSEKILSAQCLSHAVAQSRICKRSRERYALSMCESDVVTSRCRCNVACFIYIYLDAVVSQLIFNWFINVENNKINALLHSYEW